MKTMYKYYFSTSHLLCINHIHNIQLTNKMQYNFYYVFYSLISLQQVSAAIFRGTLLHLNLFILVIISPWRWQQQRPKHVAESLVNKIHHKHWRILLDFFIYYSKNISFIKSTSAWLQHQNNICTLCYWMFCF